MTTHSPLKALHTSQDSIQIMIFPFPKIPLPQTSFLSSIPTHLSVHISKDVVYAVFSDLPNKYGIPPFSNLSNTFYFSNHL